MNGMLWSWEERDLGFRFRHGEGRRVAEYYQAHKAGEFYSVPRLLAGLKKARIDELIGNVLLMQNDMLPLTTFEHQSDEVRCFNACEAGGIGKDYRPLAQLPEWEAQAIERWEGAHG